MSYQQFTLANLVNFSEGKLSVAFQKLMDELVGDCLDRPGETGERTITMKIKVQPLADQNGVAESVNIEIGMGSKKPQYKSATTTCKAHPSGAVMFNDMAPESPEQMSLDEQSPEAFD